MLGAPDNLCEDASPIFSKPLQSPHLLLLFPIPVEMHLRMLLLKGADVEWADLSHKEGNVSTRGGPDKLPCTVVQRGCSLPVSELDVSETTRLGSEVYSASRNAGRIEMNTPVTFASSFLKMEPLERI